TASVRTGQAPFAPGAGAPTSGGRLTGFFVGAPPRCEPGGHPSHPGRLLLAGERGWAPFLSEPRPGANRAGTLRTRDGCSYRGREVDRLFVGAPPRCEPARNHSLPGRVLLRGEEVDRLFCRSTASVRTGTQPFAPGAGAPTEGEGLGGFFVGAPPRCEPARNHSHPGRVLLRGEEVDRLFCRSTASVRTGTQPFAPGAGAPTGMRAGASGVYRTRATPAAREGRAPARPLAKPTHAGDELSDTWRYTCPLDCQRNQEPCPNSTTPA